MINIIFQNQDFVVIDKPAGIPVHSGVGIKEKTLVDFLLAEFPELKEVGDDKITRPGIVHRLDKETSGVMVVARSQKAFEHLKSLFKNRQVEKKYFAIVHGIPKDNRGRIEGEMGRSKRDFRKQSFVRGKISVRKERHSLTDYGVEKYFDEKALLKVLPKTGRTHQIRVHLHSIGHPIVGDEKYTFKTYKRQKYPRLFLHASEISFPDMEGKILSFKSELPEEFQNFDKQKTP